MERSPENVSLSTDPHNCSEVNPAYRGSQQPKRARSDPFCGQDTKRVAEIVMALAALARVRAGRTPSDAERALMAEARERIARMCECLAPNSLVPSNAAHTVAEDLGFVKAKDARLALHPQRLSISERVSMGTKKVEESEVFNAQRMMRLPQQQQQVKASPNLDGCGTLSGEGADLHNPQSDKLVPIPPSTRGFQSSSPVVFVSALPAPISLNQPQDSVMQPAFVLMPSYAGPMESTSSSLPLLQIEMETGRFRLDAQPTSLVQVQASSSGNHLPETFPGPCVSQPPSVTGARFGEAIKLIDHTSAPNRAHEIISFQPMPLATRDIDPKATTVQTSSRNTLTIHQPFQPMNIAHSSSYNNHNDIARNVQKILQPRVPDHSSWSPPSIDYMTQTMICQMCKVSIVDLESILVCDACEKGVHLKCIQLCHPRGIPKGDWHCSQCLMTTNGKPLPSKYGPVKRVLHSSKVSNNNGVLVSNGRKMENFHQKPNHPKTIANDNADSSDPAHVVSKGHLDNSKIKTVVDQKMSNVGKGLDSSINGMKMGVRPLHVTCSEVPNENVIQNKESSPSMLRSEQVVEPVRSCPAQLSAVALSLCHQSRTLGKPQESSRTFVQSSAEVSTDQLLSTFQSSYVDSQECRLCDPASDVRREDKPATQPTSNGTLDNGKRAQCLHGVSWIGDVLKVVDGKAYYLSCCINGAVYKLQDHALYFNNQSLSPVKLEVNLFAGFVSPLCPFQE